MNKHDKLRVFTAFQHWLGTNYTNLPTDSGNMTKRARRYLKENPQALDLFAVVGRSEQLPCKHLNTEKWGNGIKCTDCGKSF